MRYFIDACLSQAMRIALMLIAHAYHDSAAEKYCYRHIYARRRRKVTSFASLRRNAIYAAHAPKARRLFLRRFMMGMHSTK